VSDTDSRSRRAALGFVLIVGVLSLFADAAYEGSRSVLGPYLASLQAGAAAIGIITGLGELAGYGLRLVSGRWADATRKFWPITIFGYLLQMAAVPALALTGSWPAAAVLIVLERVGKATRSPPRDAMLSHAARHLGGYGRVFGIHEALDQLGALAGPLIVAGVLARRGDYHRAFAVLLVPAVITIALVLLARRLYPQPQDLDRASPRQLQTGGLQRLYWLYFAGAALIAAGFADYPLIAYHWTRTHVVPSDSIPIFYSVAMAVSGSGSLLFGRLFDRYGFKVLIVLTVVTAGFAPLVFAGGFRLALLGAAVWGLGTGVHESIIPAAVAPIVAVDRRASAFGVFTAGYGLFWFAGSAAIGILYDRSVSAALGFCLATQLAAVPLLVWVGRRHPTGRATSA
jgi:predicted MFS family arabinose efflux permease